MTRLPPILQVEDEPNDQYLLKRAFDAAFIRNPLVVANDGEEAIHYLSQSVAQHTLPSLVILDLKMPRVNGFEVLEYIRKDPALLCVPVIVFSSSAHDKDVEEAYRLGANSFVVKPAGTDEREEFAKAVKAYWLRFHQVCEGIFEVS